MGETASRDCKPTLPRVTVTMVTSPFVGLTCPETMLVPQASQLGGKPAERISSPARGSGTGLIAKPPLVVTAKPCNRQRKSLALETPIDLGDLIWAISWPRGGSLT